MLGVRTRNVPKSNSRVVALKTKASIPLIANILSNTKAREIVCSKAIYGTIPKRALTALKKMKIKINIVKLCRGRPKKHTNEKRKKILSLLKKGNTYKTISVKLKIPLRTVYHISKGIRKANKTNRHKI